MYVQRRLTSHGKGLGLATADISNNAGTCENKKHKKAGQRSKPLLRDTRDTCKGPAAIAIPHDPPPHLCVRLSLHRICRAPQCASNLNRWRPALLLDTPHPTPAIIPARRAHAHIVGVFLWLPKKSAPMARRAVPGAGFIVIAKGAVSRPGPLETIVAGGIVVGCDTGDDRAVFCTCDRFLCVPSGIKTSVRTHVAHNDTCEL